MPDMKDHLEAKLTRREALLGTLKSAMVVSLALPLMAEETKSATPIALTEFVTENDYPYFGYEPDSGA